MVAIALYESILGVEDCSIVLVRRVSFFRVFAIAIALRRNSHSGFEQRNGNYYTIASGSFQDDCAK